MQVVMVQRLPEVIRSGVARFVGVVVCVEDIEEGVGED